MTDFRARCAQLVAALDAYPLRPKAHRDLCNQVRAELEQHRQPTDDELLAAYWKGAGLNGIGTGAHILRGIRAVLQRLGGAQ
jgi:hypothetical protein